MCFLGTETIHLTWTLITVKGTAWTVVASCTALVISFDSPEGVMYNYTILGAMDYKWRSIPEYKIYQKPIARTLYKGNCHFY